MTSTVASREEFGIELRKTQRELPKVERDLERARKRFVAFGSPLDRRVIERLTAERNLAWTKMQALESYLGLS